MQLHPLEILQSLILISAANSAPVIAKRIFGDRYTRPIDGGLFLSDGNPLLGSSKTWRGLVAAILSSTCAATLIGLPAQVGLFAGACAMAGDCFSSFIKRRLHLKSSSMAIGLDQIPESLFPAILCRFYLQLGYIDILAVVLIFFVGELFLSWIFFTIGLRDEPY
jgi:hypothetical protein